MAEITALVVGIALLTWASDQFVLGAARIATLRGIAPLVVGVVIIGFGTSSPELIVSVLAALRGEQAVAIGNIVGSNLANLGLILGLGVLIYPLNVDSGTVRREAPLTVGAMALFALVVRSGPGRLEATALLLAMTATLLIVMRRRPSDPLGPATEEFVAERSGRLPVEILRTALGLIGTLGASQLLLWGALGIADRFRLSQGLVGATIVAVGTSLPELVTVIQAARRREGDLILGNLLGSNLFNSLMVGGAFGLVAGGTIDAPNLTGFGATAAVAQGTAVWFLMRTGRRISRIEGAVLLVSYGALIPFLSGT